jgi:hypothetical protein
VGDLVGVTDQIGIRPRRLVADQAAAVAATPRRGGIEQLVSAIEVSGVGQRRQVEDQLRPLLARREVIPGKGVDVRRVWDLRCLLAAEATTLL